MKNRREKLLKDLLNVLLDNGVDYYSVCTNEKGEKGIRSFVIEHDDGTNHGDNIEITASEFIKYAEQSRKNKENDD